MKQYKVHEEPKIMNDENTNEDACGTKSQILSNIGNSNAQHQTYVKEPPFNLFEQTWESATR